MTHNFNRAKIVGITHCVTLVFCNIWIYRPNKHKTLTQCWSKVSPTFTTLGQHLGQRLFLLQMYCNKYRSTEVKTSATCFTNLGQRKLKRVASWRQSVLLVQPSHRYGVTSGHATWACITRGYRGGGSRARYPCFIIFYVNSCLATF